uniref:Uncharacterized protein n=1 Tax=Anguilla anguilla TaxID=7936 RepID=A0A0E9U908_ANGAN
MEYVILFILGADSNFINSVILKEM